MLGCSNWSLILKRKEMPEQNYAVATVPLTTPGDHWADGKLLGDALNSCAGGTQGPLVNAHWFCAFGLEPSLQRLWRSGTRLLGGWSFVRHCRTHAGV